MENLLLKKCPRLIKAFIVKLLKNNFVLYEFVNIYSAFVIIFRLPGVRSFISKVLQDHKRFLKNIPANYFYWKIKVLWPVGILLIAGCLHHRGIDPFQNEKILSNLWGMFSAGLFVEYKLTRRCFLSLKNESLLGAQFFDIYLSFLYIFVYTALQVKTSYSIYMFIRCFFKSNLVWTGINNTTA